MQYKSLHNNYQDDAFVANANCPKYCGKKLFGFRMQAETVAFGNNAEQDNAWWLDSTEVELTDAVAYLGIHTAL